MAIAYVNRTSGSSETGVTSVNCTAANHSAGGLLVVGVKFEGGATTVTASDTAGNTFTGLTARTNTNNDLRSRILYSANITGHATNVVQVQFAASRAFSRIFVLQYSGCDATPFDQENFGQSGSGTSMTTGNVTTTVNDEVLVVFAGEYNAQSGYTAGTNFTERADGPVDFGYAGSAAEDRIVTATGTYAGAMTQSLSSAWILNMATFKIDGGAAAGQPTMRRWGGVPGMTPGGNASGRSWFKGLTLPSRRPLLVPRRALLVPDRTLKRAA